LKFAEIYFTQAGQRQFDIVINGKTVLSNLDIIARAGAANTALDLSFSVNVTGGTVTIEFDPGAANNPQVNAIQIQ
jgi:hypothetical protein